MNHQSPSLTAVPETQASCHTFITNFIIAWNKYEKSLTISLNNFNAMFLTLTFFESMTSPKPTGWYTLKISFLMGTAIYYFLPFGTEKICLKLATPYLQIPNETLTWEKNILFLEIFSAPNTKKSPYFCSSCHFWGSYGLSNMGTFFGTTCMFCLLVKINMYVWVVINVQYILKTFFVFIIKVQYSSRQEWKENFGRMRIIWRVGLHKLTPGQGNYPQ